jgi:hypothetical protein
MTGYYVSRTLISLGLGGLFALLGAPWWLAALAGLLALAMFLYAPLSGRYTVQRENGVNPLGRDEFSQSVTAKAGRNAFVFLMIALGGILVFAQLTGRAAVPVSTLSVLLALGVVVFFVSDYAMRRV